MFKAFVACCKVPNMDICESSLQPLETRSWLCLVARRLDVYRPTRHPGRSKSGLRSAKTRAQLSKWSFKDPMISFIVLFKHNAGTTGADTDAWR